MADFPLDIRTEIRVGDTWSNISGDVYVRDVKRITRGLRDQGSAADPSTLTFTLNNKGGKYSRRNAMSPLFGLLSQNTPVRLSVPADESYLQLDGQDNGYASTTDTADLHITGDLDVRAEISPDWYGTSNQLVIGRWDRPSLNQSWVLQVYNQQVSFRITSTGDEYATGSGSAWSVNLPTLPERAAIRATIDVDNGSGGTTVTFYWAPSLAGPWTVIGLPIVRAGVSTIFAGTAPLRIGMSDYRNGVDLSRHPLDGRAHRFEVRNGIGGPVVASPDFRSAPDGATSITDAQGRVWSVNGTAEIRRRDDRFVGEISSWPLRWSVDDVDVWTPVTASGILRRLGQGAKALESTLRRRIPSGNPIAYWPLEEQQDATRAYSPIPGVFPASVSSVEWAGVDTLPSSAPLPRLTGISSLAAQVPAFPPGQWQVEMVYNADDNIPLTDSEVLKIFSADGTIRRWELLQRNGRATVRGYNAANALIVNRFISIGADVFHGWVRLRFYCRDEGGSTVWAILWQGVGGGAGFFSATTPGTCGSVASLAADWPAETEGWSVGHISVLKEAGSFLYDGSDDAFLGETAWERMSRLASEEGLSATRTAGRLPVEYVGYQRREQLVNLFEAAANADGGLLTEDMRRIGLHYRDRSSLYTQDPVITLSYTAPGLGPDIEPVDDDSSVVNDVTVVRDGGSSARAVQTDGPLSVDRIGKYDTSIPLSLAHDEQTDPHAYWRLHLGTFDGARYPSVSLLLHKPGAQWLIPLVRQLREGDRIRITDLPEWVSHNDVDLIVLGWSEDLDLYRWEITFNCAPAGPYDTAMTDHAKFGKADTDGSVLELPATATATSLLVRTLAGPTWAEAPEYLPYDIRVSGEVMTVTAVGPSGADKFERTLASGWGAADSGQTWKQTGGVTSDRSVSAGKGVITLPSSVSTVRAQTIPLVLGDADVRVRITAGQVSTGASLVPGVLFRWSSSAECYRARIHFGTGGTMFVSITRGSTTLGAQPSLPYTYTAGAEFELRAQVIGHTVRIKAWPVGQAEPANWHHTATVTDSPIAAGEVGLSGSGFTGNTNTSPSFRFDNFAITDTQAFTVVRSVNGVIKPQAAGTAVNIANRPIASL